MPVRMTTFDTYFELQKRGFQRLTRWVLNDGRIKPESWEWDNCAGWIYAFVVERRVRYIGIATTVLRSRLAGYAYQINDRVGAAIASVIESGTEVEIFGTKRPHASKSELEAEESDLISLLATDWNVRR